jgi:hypothetical protein
VKIKLTIIFTIILAIALKFFFFNDPNYLGKWDNIEEKQHLTILKNNLVIYQFEGFPDSYGDWSEINNNEILIRYKLFGTIDQNAKFKSNSGKVGYFDNHTRTVLFTRIEN